MEGERGTLEPERANGKEGTAERYEMASEGLNKGRRFQSLVSSLSAVSVSSFPPIHRLLPSYASFLGSRRGPPAVNGGRVRSRDAEQPRRLTNPTETPEIKDEQRII